MNRSYFNTDDTITAIATPPGEGAISIVRISGKYALSILQKCYPKNIFKYKSHTVHYGQILSKEKKIIDNVLLLIMLAPKTYTGEDCVEIHCHGGTLITKKVLQRIISLGARPANPGEFTFRAFLNKKIDLTQAEAVQQLISAKNEQAMIHAENHLEGLLSKKILSFQDRLIDIAANIDAMVDFPEEDIDFSTQNKIKKSLTDVINDMKILKNTYHDGKVIFDGLNIGIVGTPNVGKSSLMNILLRKDRSIVTHIPGTTRDSIEDKIKIGPLYINLIDTAGIRTSEEIVEQIGIEKSKKILKQADLSILVLDSSKQLSKEDYFLLDMVKKEKTIIVWNKIDIAKAKISLDFPNQVNISALKDLGIEILKEMIQKVIKNNSFSSKEEIIISELRHKKSLTQAIDSCKLVISNLDNNISLEFIADDIKHALTHLGNIIGINLTEDILTTIFSKFCIGK